MTTYSAFQCCLDAPTDRHSFLSPDGTEPRFERIGEIIETGLPAPPRCGAVAYHEAGHAVLALALGGRATAVTIDGQPCATTSGLAMRDFIAMTLAGPAAADWQRRHVFRPYDDMLKPLLAVVDCGGGGSCDHCSALRLSTLLAPEGDLDTALAVFRQLEAEAIRLVQAPPIWTAIRDLAAALMAAGSLAEAEISTIAARHFRPGEFSLSSSAQE